MKKQFRLPFLIIFLFLSNISYSQDTDIEPFLKKHIDKLIQDGYLKENPLIVIQGIPIDSTNKSKFYTILWRSDVEELLVLKEERALEIYSKMGENGVLLVVCNRNGKKKIRKME